MDGIRNGGEWSFGRFDLENLKRILQQFQTSVVKATTMSSDDDDDDVERSLC